MAVETTAAGTVITGPHIELFRLKTFLRGLQAQKRGMALTRGPSALARLKREGIVKSRTVDAAIVELQGIIDAWTEPQEDDYYVE